MSTVALILALAALTTTAYLAVVIDRRLCQMEALAAVLSGNVSRITSILARLDADVEDLWGTANTLDLDQETTND